MSVEKEEEKEEEEEEEEEGEGEKEEGEKEEKEGRGNGFFNETFHFEPKETVDLFEASLKGFEKKMIEKKVETNMKLENKHYDESRSFWFDTIKKEMDIQFQNPISVLGDIACQDLEWSGDLDRQRRNFHLAFEAENILALSGEMAIERLLHQTPFRRVRIVGEGEEEEEDEEEGEDEEDEEEGEEEGSEDESEEETKMKGLALLPPFPLEIENAFVQKKIP